MTKILIGADPELFIFDGNRVVPAAGLVPGTKYFPHPVDGGAIQVDGVAAEFNIQPAEDEDQFVSSIIKVERQLLDTVLSHNSSLILRAQPTVKFTRRQWNMIPEESKALGCEPDFSAYTLEANKPPETNKFMRTGSGHIHISWGVEQEDQYDSEHMKTCADLVKHLDWHLYENSLKWDNDKERQELYGKPGSFRPKTYGVEYRTLSNKWVSTEKTIRYVFKTAQEVTRNWLKGLDRKHYEVEAFYA